MNKIEKLNESIRTLFRSEGEKFCYIRSHYLGKRTADCAGFIKGYCWYNPETDSVNYATNGMPDLGANQMYQTATVKGPISTMPEIPGLAVWHQGHIGVYIGNGYAIEAMGTRYGVVKTRVSARSWTHWLKIPYINYIEETEEGIFSPRNCCSPTSSRQNTGISCASRVGKVSRISWHRSMPEPTEIPRLKNCSSSLLTGCPAPPGRKCTGI